MNRLIKASIFSFMIFILSYKVLEVNYYKKELSLEKIKYHIVTNNELSDYDYELLDVDNNGFVNMCDYDKLKED